MARAILDVELLRAALIGYRQQAVQLAAKIAELENRIGASESSASPTPKRVFSAAIRRSMAAAQKKRWAAARAHEVGGAKAPAPPAPAKKRRISAAGRKRIAEATKKRWAAYRAQTTAAEK